MTRDRRTCVCLGRDVEEQLQRGGILAEVVQRRNEHTGHAGRQLARAGDFLDGFGKERISLRAGGSIRVDIDSTKIGSFSYAFEFHERLGGERETAGIGEVRWNHDFVELFGK